MKDFVAGMKYYKQFETAKSITAEKGISDSDWSAIQAFMNAPEEFNKEDIQVFEMNLANNQVDRDRERFSEDVLKSFKKTLPGKSFLIAHKWGPPGEGLFYKASLKEEDGVLWLKAKFYVLVEHSGKLIQMIKAGIWKFVSIGYSAPTLVRIPKADDAAQAQYWEYRNSNDNEAEALEGSLVWLGAQYEAEIKAKMLDKNFIKEFKEIFNNEFSEENSMEFLFISKQLGISEHVKSENELKTIMEMIDEEVAKLKGDSILDSKFFEDVKALFPEDRQKTLTVNDIKELKETSDAYRKSLLEETVKFGKLIKMLPEDETELQEQVDFYKELDTNRLENQLKLFKGKYAEQNPGYSEINASSEEQDNKGEKDMVEIPGPSEF